MKLKMIDFCFGCSRLKAEGVFAERIINIAKETGIFVQDVSRSDDKTIFFTVSRQGAKKLLDTPLSDQIHLSVEKSYGLPAILESNRNRLLLIFCPVVIFMLLFLSTGFIWHVNIVDADPDTEKHLLAELERLGVRRGVLKAKIDQGHIKNELLISNPDLRWIWVDIRGASAIVKYELRTPAPILFDEDTFYNIYSTRDAVITKLQATNGIAKVSVGDTVLQGQLLIEGSIAQNAEERRKIHASGEVWGEVWEEKQVVIPKKREIRTPNGEKTEHLSINFANFRLNLFINSSILYPDYDIIEESRNFLFFPVTFNKTEYVSVSVSYTDNDIDAVKKQYEEEFHASLTQQGFQIHYSESNISDAGEYVTYTMRALCEEPIAAERRMYIGEDNTSTNG